MDNYVGLAFEELSYDEMMNLQGGAGEKALTWISGWKCVVLSVAITAITYLINEM